MASRIQLLRSTTPQERPFPDNLADGQPAVNLNESEPGLFFKADDGSIIKIGPAAITSDGNPPNFSAQGETGNAIGELWLDKSVVPAELKIYDGTDWVTATGGSSIPDGSITAAKLAPNAVTSPKLATGAVTETKIANGAVTAQKIANNTITSAQLSGGAVNENELADGAVTEAKIADLAVTEAKLDVDAVVTAKIATGAVTSAKLDSDAVTSVKIAAGAVTEQKLGSQSVTAGKIGAGAVTEGKIGTGAVTEAKIGSGAITDDKVSATAAIVANKLSFLADSSATARSVESKLKDVVSVLDFGADPTGAVSSSAAIQAAIDTVDADGGAVYFPAGTYYVTESITVTGNGVHLVGAGKEATTLTRDDGGTYGPTIVFSNNGAATATVRNFYNSVSHMTLYDDVAATSNSHILVDWQAQFNLHSVNLWNPYVGVDCRTVGFDFYDVTVEYTRGKYVAGTVGYAAFWWQSNPAAVSACSGTITNCQVLVRQATHNTYPALYNYLLNAADGIWMTSCYGRAARNDAFSLWPKTADDRVTGVRMIGCWADYPGSSAINIKNQNSGNCRNHDITNFRNYAGIPGNSYGEDTTLYGIIIGSTTGAEVRTVTISQASISNTHKSGIELRDTADDVHIVAPNVWAASSGTVGLDPSINVRSNVSNWSIIGGRLDGDGEGNLSSASAGVRIANGTSDNYQIIGTSVTRCQTDAGVIDNGTGLNKVIFVAGKRVKGLMDTVSVKDFGAVGDGVADDSDAIQAALDAFPTVETTTNGTVYKRGNLFFPTGSYKITKQITIYPGVSLTGPPISSRYFVAGSTDVEFDLGATILLDNPTVEDAIVYNSGRLENSTTVISNLIFTHTTRPSSAINANAILIRGGTKVKFYQCNFYRLRYQTILKLGATGYQCNGIRVSNCNFGYIGDAISQVVQPGTGYTYGNCIDGTLCYDSKYSDNFAESCGGYFYIGAAGNNVFSSNFVDLNKGALYVVGGNRMRVVNNNFKWNQDDGIYLENVESSVIVGNTIQGNNYKSSTTRTTIGWGIRLENSKDIVISGNNLNDDYAGTSHSKYKSVRQGNIKFGTQCTAAVSNCLFSEVDTGNSSGYPTDPDAAPGAGWESVLQDDNGFWDEGSGGLSSGRVTIVSSRKSNYVDTSNLINIPQPAVNPPTNASTVSVVKRWGVRDIQGNVIGSIPIYDVAGSNLLTAAVGDVTATITAGSGTITLDSTENKLKYCKVGQTVTVTGSLLVQSVSTPGGSLEIGGLPYAAVDGPGTSGSAAASLRIVNTNGVASGSYWTSRIIETTSRIELSLQNGDAGVVGPAAVIQAGTRIQLSITYITS